jgi:hypothetical protein
MAYRIIDARGGRKVSGVGGAGFKVSRFQSFKGSRLKSNSNSKSKDPHLPTAGKYGPPAQGGG